MVEVSAESISENDPASSPLATSTDYAMTRTLGRTGVAIYRGDDGNSVQSTSVECSRTNLVSVLPGSQSKSNRSLSNFCHGLNAYNFPRILHRNASSMCYVKYGRLIFSCTPTGTLRSKNHFFPRTLTRPLSPRKTIRVIHGKATFGHNCVLTIKSLL